MQENTKTNENEHTYDNGFHPHEVKLKDNYKFYNRNIFFRICSFIVVFISKIIFLIIKYVFVGFRIKGYKNFRKNKHGNIVICNHCMPLDIFYIVSSFFPVKYYVTMLQSNLGFPIASQYFRICAAVPIPTDRRLLRKFNAETVETIKRGDNIVFFAEASLMPYCDHIRPFMPGAFHYAYMAGGKILPMCYTFHKPRGFYRLVRRKPCPTLNILPAYQIEEMGTKSETIKKACDDVHKIIYDYFEEHNEYKDGQYKKRKK